MEGKIALEEHFAIIETADDHKAFMTDEAQRRFIREKVLDLHGERLELMDQAGIEMDIISLNAPAIQGILDVKRADDIAKTANDVLAEECAKRPDRFAGFAALPMQDPDLAARELIRCVKDYGFKGALVNGFSNLGVEDSSLYYDLPQYWDFWAEVEKLDVPFYLHPRGPLMSQLKSYEGHPWLVNPVWGFSVETGTHALRLMGSGLFDKYPRLNIILGHFGELIPANIWRTAHRIQVNPMGCPAEKSFKHYLCNNFYVTTSGNFSLTPLVAALMEMGSDRIMFATDYPFESIPEAAEWFDGLEISENERLKIGRTNAIELFKL